MPIKIKSAQGSVTLSAENATGDQTLTIPSLSGGKTLLTTDGSGASLTNLPAGGVAGITTASSSGTAINITSGNLVGIGESTPLAKLHIKEGDSGATSISSNFDQLVLEDDLHSGMVILSGTSSDGAIYFGDSGSSSAGQIKYKHSDNSLNLATDDLDRLKIDSSGRVTMPNLPAFSVYSTVDGPSTTGQDPVPLNDIVFHDGNYNTTLHRYTVPVTGKWLFTYNLNWYRSGDSRYISAFFKINGTVKGKAYSFINQVTSSTHTSVQLTEVHSMTANDYITIGWDAGATLQCYYAGGKAFFEGYLIG